MNFIIFDFDGTIAKSSDYHRKGWELTMTQLKISGGLNTFLPYEPDLKERFDSYRRIQAGIVRNKSDFESLKSYFNTNDEAVIAREIMKVKESYTITCILEDLTENIVSKLGNRVIDLLEDLSEDKKNLLGVISSSRKTIVSSFLQKTGLIQFFKVVIGEEDMYDGEKLIDKPNRFAFDQLLKKVDPVKPESIYYIGDDELIDKEFAKNIDATYVKAKYDMDFLNIKII